jgi:ATP-binding protein involved in chromosome partitioning
MHPFGSGGGQTLADELGVPLLGQVPLEDPLREGADSGTPLVVERPDAPSARAIAEIALALPGVLRPRPAAERIGRRLSVIQSG